MITKKQSKKINQFKYFVLIPVLLGMLFYSSCSEELFNNDQVSKKESFNMYMFSKGNLEKYKNTRETYLDAFLGDYVPENFIEVPFSELDANEKVEFEKLKLRFGKPNYISYQPLKVFKTNSNRKIIGYIRELKNSNLKNIDYHLY